MGKPFFEAIPAPEVSEEMRALLELVTVDKVKVSRDRKNLRIYLISPRLIHKKNIFNLEGQICRQLFPDYGMTVKIVEKFELSAQYTPKKLWELYYDSILLELRSYSLILSNILKESHAEFTEENILSLEMQDNIVTRDRENELKEILEKIFNERCGFGVEVRLLHDEIRRPEKNDYSEHLVNEMVREIVSHSSFGVSEDEPSDNGGAGNGQADKNAENKNAGQGRRFVSWYRGCLESPEWRR